MYTEEVIDDIYLPACLLMMLHPYIEKHHTKRALEYTKKKGKHKY
jgi:hypothetical protein